MNSYRYRSVTYVIQHTWRHYRKQFVANSNVATCENANDILDDRSIFVPCLIKNQSNDRLECWSISVIITGRLTNQ